MSFILKVTRLVFACRQVKYDYGDRTLESILEIQDFQDDDLNREFNCSVKNKRGFNSSRAELQEEGECKLTATQAGSHFRRVITSHTDV